jgi:hypothetical protein
MLAIGFDGAEDQTRVERGEPVGMDKILATGGWRKILDQDVRVANQSCIDVGGILRPRLPGGSWRSTALWRRLDPREVQLDALLTAIPDEITAAPGRGYMSIDHPDDSCAVVTE